MSIEITEGPYRIVRNDKYYLLKGNLHTAIFEELNKKYALTTEDIDETKISGIIYIVSEEDILTDAGSMLDNVKKYSLESRELTTEGLFIMVDMKTGKSKNKINSLNIPSNANIFLTKNALLKGLS